jgi:hypothetical protein
MTHKPRQKVLIKLLIGVVAAQFGRWGVSKSKGKIL